MTSGTIPYKYQLGMEQLEDMTCNVCAKRIPN